MLLKKEEDPTEIDQPNDSLIIRVAARIMTPFIQLFGLYVVAHGHYSPGVGISRWCYIRRQLNTIGNGERYAFC